MPKAQIKYLFKKDYKLLNSLIKDRIFKHETAIEYINTKKKPNEYFENLKIKHYKKIKELEKLAEKLKIT